MNARRKQLSDDHARGARRACAYAAERGLAIVADGRVSVLRVIVSPILGGN